jgi:TonB-linked SusC/RagA family outer membrane protein
MMKMNSYYLKVLKQMKLTFVFLVLTCLHVSAKTYSQDRITLRLESVDIKKAMQIIERKTDYHFLYNEAVIANTPKISINVINAEISTVLDKLFLTNNISYRILNNNLVVLKNNLDNKTVFQDIRITGKVTGNAGEPLAGVSISIKGTNIGTTTDASGNFSISVPDASSTLVFSYVGFATQEIVVGNRTSLNVALAGSASQLDQIVVVGYGTQRKRDITGSVARVNGNEITKQPVLTATQGLQGQVAGVQIISSGSPNSAPIVRIRGTGSILGGVNPLYVVDGILTDDIRNINTADIVSVDILKDASASAIYGVRAANGVVIITTKKGQSGKMVVSYDANGGMREASGLVKMANAQQYANYINQASINTGNGAVLVDPSLTNTSTDWYGTILRRAYEQNHNVSVSGGSEKVNYFLSFNYLTDEGIVINNKFQRFTIRSNNEYRLSDKVRVNTLLSYGRGTTQDVNLGAAYNDAYHAAPIIPAIVNGKYGNTSAYQNVGNPLLDINNADNKYIENRFQGTGSIDYKPIKWLTLHTSFGVELAFNNRDIFINQFLNDSNTFLVPGGNQVNNKSSLSIQNEHNTRWVWDNTATFQRSFALNDITFLVGQTSEKVQSQADVASRTGVPFNPDLRYLSQGDPGSQLNNSNADVRTRNSYIARLSYAYDRKYLLTGTFRADGTSQFSQHWAYNPAVGLGWVISDEKFMSNQNLFNNLKLRASYGTLGNDNIPLSASIQTLNTGLPYFFNGTYVTGIAFAGLIDKNIRWETTKEADIGLEFTMLSNKLYGELDVYDKKVNNALIQVPVAPITGASLIYTNVASIENRGVELSLRWNGTIRKDFTYYVSANGSYNNNNVIALNGGQSIPSGSVGSQGYTTLTNNNVPVGSFYLLQASGVFHNQQEIAAYVTKNGAPVTINGQAPNLGDIHYLDVNGDGKIDANDRVYSGSYQPKFTIGVNGGVNYTSFDLSINIYGTIGSKIYNGKKAARFNQKDNVEASVATNFWTFTNYTSNVPRADLNALPASTYFLESGDFGRINNLTIGYTFTNAVLRNHGITRLRLYLTSQNLATFTKYSGFTPELASSDPLSQGIELNAYPTTRTFAFGINLNF